MDSQLSKQTPLGTTDAAEVDSMPLDLTRRDDAGNPIDDETYSRLCEREYAERERDTPRDCVTEVPLHSGRTLLLVSWDADGQPGPTMSLDAKEVEDGDATYLLERCRAIYRRTHPRRLKAV